jgi:hypothetical protein
LVQSTAILENNQGKTTNPSKAIVMNQKTGGPEVFSILGRKMNTHVLAGKALSQKTMGLYFERMPDGSLQKRIYCSP